MVGSNLLKVIKQVALINKGCVKQTIESLHFYKIIIIYINVYCEKNNRVFMELPDLSIQTI